jgi:hypothetical protein
VISDRRPELCALLEKILTEEALGEDFGYDIAPAMAVVGSNIVTGYLLMLSCRSPVLVPPRMCAPHLLSDMWPDEARLRVAVKECLKSLAALRLQLLTPSAKP